MSAPGARAAAGGDGAPGAGAGGGALEAGAGAANNNTNGGNSASQSSGGPFSGRPRKPKRRNAMEKKLSILVCLLLLAGSGHGLRILHDVDGDFGQGFAFGSKAAAAADETEPLDPLLDDYENEISHLEFEPVDAAADAAAAAPAPGPAAEAGSAAGSDSMKWWLPPSTIPSFPLFPGMPGLGMPLPGIPFKPIGWGSPAAPGQYAPDPPAGAGADGDADPSAASQVINAKSSTKPISMTWHTT